MLICSEPFRYKIDDFERRINSISLFQHEIKPMWEDKMNEQGGEFQINFKCEDPDLIQKLWERLVFCLITGVFPLT